MRNLNKIQYIKPNIGHFPNLSPIINHGFSWGANAKNMSFKYGKNSEVRENIKEFLKKLEMGDIYHSFNILSQHKDKIIDIKEKNYKPSPNGVMLKCDAAFTSLPKTTITVKPADCTTAIVHGKNSDTEIIGIIHTGRHGVQAELPKKAVKHILKEYGIKPHKITLAIVPSISKESKKFIHTQELDPKIWDGFIKKENGYYHILETELALKQYKKAGIIDKNISIYNVDTYQGAKDGVCFSNALEYELAQKNIPIKKGRFIVAIRMKKPN